jgi:hypothetical protein
MNERERAGTPGTDCELRDWRHMFLVRIAARVAGLGVLTRRFAFGVWRSALRPRRGPSAFANALVVERASLARPTLSGWQHRARGYGGQDSGELSRVAVLESWQTECRSSGGCALAELHPPWRDWRCVKMLTTVLSLKFVHFLEDSLDILVSFLGVFA